MTSSTTKPLALCLSNMRITVVLVLSLAFGQFAHADDYPVKTIRFVVPASPGSAVDIRARQVADLISPKLNQTIMVDNRPGASGALAAQLVAKAKPDGYTLLSCTGGTHGVSSALTADLGYDPERDFVPVVRVVTSPMLMVVNPSLAAKTVGDLVQLAKAKPGAIRYGSAGNASPHHLAAALFSNRANVQMTHVPYKGDGLAMTDVIAGHIDILFAAPLVLLPQVQAGKLKPLGVTGTKRLPALPDVPTMKEAGLSNAEFTVWSGLCAPVGTSRSVVERINQEVLTALMKPEVKDEIVRQGYDVSINSPDEFAAFIANEIAKAKKLVKELNIQAQD